jgi:predicted methyltransferase
MTAFVWRRCRLETISDHTIRAMANDILTATRVWRYASGSASEVPSKVHLTETVKERGLVSCPSLEILFKTQ